MAKLLLLSVVLAMVTIPLVASRSAHPVKGLKKALLALLVFNLCYLVGAVAIYYVQGFNRAPPASLLPPPSR